MEFISCYAAHHPGGFYEIQLDGLKTSAFFDPVPGNYEPLDSLFSSRSTRFEAGGSLSLCREAAVAHLFAWLLGGCLG